ncbi:DUF4129 domain-containing protein [Cellulomonas edaphi]|uniref:DUF4129 domain-containing protein n=1 Tax=Cellulomonas edaphi TaxID=3053468 RepID=A0ABT7S869_9CELL|nr:DUF4129 domain-containing protein [Cellulomons edaphi]MDM7831729.1 DUF4129 domain-containing protein [Cellulomons edaphi]
MIAGVHLDVPVAPDGPTARRWAVQELSHPEYHQHESLLARFMRWVLERFESLGGYGFSGSTAALVAVGVLVALVLVAFLVAGPVRRTRRVARAGAVHVQDDARTADQMRAAADAAGRAGDYSLAVVERFRALVRGLEERLVIDERPGRTAHEASADAGARLPALAPELHGAAAAFDAVAYGGRTASADDAARLQALEERVQNERVAHARPAGDPAARPAESVAP